ncbi:MAG: hypothetical protein ACE5E1_00100 [Phycisphaerae bacterium]
MSRKTLRRFKKVTLVVTTGMTFGALSCVQTVTDAMGTGLSLGSLLTPGGPAANPLGVGLDFLADILRLAA